MTSLADAAFLMGAPRVRDLPPDTGAEVAFAGRSNAGKSSALNALTGRSSLARVSKTPGRTQQLNVFVLGPALRLVDLPGYGYAKVPHALRHGFAALASDYVAARQSLRGLVLVADIRQGLKDEDHGLLARRPGLPVLVLLSKVDKLNRAERDRRWREITADLSGRATLLSFSAHTGEGVAAARAAVLDFLGGP